MGSKKDGEVMLESLSWRITRASADILENGRLSLECRDWFVDRVYMVKFGVMADRGSFGMLMDDI